MVAQYGPAFYVAAMMQQVRDAALLTNIEYIICCPAIGAESGSGTLVQPSKVMQ